MSLHLSPGPSVYLFMQVMKALIGLGFTIKCSMHVGWGTREAGCGESMRGRLHSCLGLHVSLFIDQ
jgi:hypothetical protein